MQESIVQNFWLQFGAVGILALSGWAVAWILWKEHTKKAEQYILMLKEVTALAEESKVVIALLSDRIPQDIDHKLDLIAEGLSVQELVRELMKQKRRSARK